MHPQIFPTYQDLSSHVAQKVFFRIEQHLRDKNHMVLGLATGKTPIGLYAHLLALFETRPDLNLSGLVAFNLDEYYPIPPTAPHSYHSEMQRMFFGPLQEINPSFRAEQQTHIPHGDTPDIKKECRRYEEAIHRHGSIDLQILGIGTNGHIGFNEPGSDDTTRTRLVDLAPETIQINADKFFHGDTNQVPRQAISMGVGTILEATEIFLLASGSSKRAILQDLRERNEPTPHNPASYLLRHPHVRWFVDDEAWGEYKERK